MATIKRICALFLIFLPFVSASGDTMAVKVQEFTMRDFTRPGVELYHTKGDFHSASGLYTDPQGLLRRAPAWSAHVAHAGLTNVRGLFYDHDNARYVLVGTNASSHVATAYFNTAWSLSAITDMSSAIATLGGASMRNCIFFGGYLYVIGSNRYVYRDTTGYSTSFASFYTGGDADVLASAGDRVYMITTAGTIYRLADDAGSFVAYINPVVDFKPLFATPYRSYLAILGQHRNGRMTIFRVPLANASGLTLDEVASLDLAAPNPPTYGCLAALHEDKIYFAPGPRQEPNGTYTLDVYVFNGSFLQPAGQIRNAPAATATQGLTSWRGQLIYYGLTSTSDQVIKILVGDDFVDFVPSASIDCSQTAPLLAVLGGDLIVTAMDTTTQGIHHAGRTTLADAYFISSKLDFGQPGRQKRLEQLSVILDNAATDFNVIIKYRTDDTTAWTTATTADGSRIVRIGGLGVTFYTLQVRVDLDDDTGSDTDARIAAVDVIYSEDK